MRINIVDVVNRVDIYGNPIGHEKKAILQAIMLLEGINIRLFVHKSYRFNDIHNFINLPFKIETVKNGNCIILKEYFKMILNSLISILKCKSEIMWFIIAYEPLFWIIAFLPKKNKYIITTYINWNEKFKDFKILKRVRKIVINKAIKKLNLLIVTNKKFKPNCNNLFFPDFFLDKKYYFLRELKKENFVLCVGVMKREKKLVEIINLCEKYNVKLVIAGPFVEEKYYLEVIKNMKKYVEVINDNLAEDKYMEYIARAKYVILPYDWNNYSNRTSGVLQEVVALKAIPIAPKELLEYNQIVGIGYDKLEEAFNLMLKYEKEYMNDYREYEYEYCKNKFNFKLKEINIL